MDYNMRMKEAKLMDILLARLLSMITPAVWFLIGFNIAAIYSATTPISVLDHAISVVMFLLYILILPYLIDKLKEQ